MILSYFLGIVFALIFLLLAFLYFRYKFSKIKPKQKRILHPSNILFLLLNLILLFLIILSINLSISLNYFNNKGIKCFSEMLFSNSSNSQDICLSFLNNASSLELLVISFLLFVVFIFFNLALFVKKPKLFALLGAPLDLKTKKEKGSSNKLREAFVIIIISFIISFLFLFYYILSI